MNIERDVIIVGAGVAGSICGAYLAKAGVDVLLLDKEVFPRNKACGDILRESVATHINRLGLFDELDKMGSFIKRIHLISDNGSECIIPFDAYAAPRFQLDNMLAQVAVKRGAEFRDGCRVRSLISEDGYIKGVQVRENGVDYEIRGRLVIIADGAGNLVPATAESGKTLPQQGESALPVGNAQDSDAHNFGSGGKYLGERAYFAGVHLEEVLAKGQYNAYAVCGFNKKLANGYYWVTPSGAKGVQEGYCNVGFIRDAEASENVSAEELFNELKESNKRIASLFANAEQVSPWRTETVMDVNGVGNRYGNGYLVIGNAGSIMMPLLMDGTGAAADTGEIAAMAAKEAINANNFSEEFLATAYGDKIHIDEDRLKYENMTVESLYDRTLNNTMIARMVNNPTYTNRVLNEVFGK